MESLLNHIIQIKIDITYKLETITTDCSHLLMKVCAGKISRRRVECIWFWCFALTLLFLTFVSDYKNGL